MLGGAAAVVGAKALTSWRRPGGGAGDAPGVGRLSVAQLHLRDELERKASQLRGMWIGGGGNDEEGKCLALAVDWLGVASSPITFKALTF